MTCSTYDKMSFFCGGVGSSSGKALVLLPRRSSKRIHDAVLKKKVKRSVITLILLVIALSMSSKTTKNKAAAVWGFSTFSTITTIRSERHRRINTRYNRSTRFHNMVTDSNNNNLDKGFNLLESASKVVPQGNIVLVAKESWKFVWRRFMAELAPQSKDGSYKRPTYDFQGRLGSTQYPAGSNDKGRYVLFVGNPCPWCHRTKLALLLRNLPNDIIIVELRDDPIKASRGGWIILSSDQKNLPQGFSKCVDLREIYDTCIPNYKGRCTAPLLVDSKTKTIVSNESSDIVRMFNEVNFGSSDEKLDLYPAELADEINKANEWIYNLINNGVYRCGFSTTQEAYNKASEDVREGLKLCETILEKQKYLCSNDKFTEADLRLLPTVLRYDGVYGPLFKAGGTHLSIQSNYPNVHKWLVRCWKEYPEISQSIDIEDANASYYKQLFPLNPSGIIPTPMVNPKDLGLT